MTPVRARVDGADILYDAEALGKIATAWFDPAYWRAHGALVGEAHGRGTVWFVHHEGGDWVLRHYRRGGMLGPWLGDRYLWLGFKRTRAAREWQLLAVLRERGLPVPRPVAARVRRSGLCYRADLLTERIPDARPLSALLTQGPLAPARWRAIGACLRRFHAAGAYHADLNAHNILLAGEQVYLVDFDRGRLRAPGSWQVANLARLQRSLGKLARTRTPFHYDATCWSALLAGYEGEEAGASSGQSSASAAR